MIAYFVVSLDHCPSEQLVSAEDWHTSVFVISGGNEHWDLSEKIAIDLKTQSGRLRKWSSRNARANYHGRFVEALFQRITEYPVHVRAVSARARTIKTFGEDLIAQGRMAGLLKKERIGDKFYYAAHSLTRASPNLLNGRPVLELGETSEFMLPENRALHLAFLVHEIVRVHGNFLGFLQTLEDSKITALDWQLMPNKLPGGLEGGMATVLSLALNTVSLSGLCGGNIRVLTLTEDQLDRGSHLADNIAGFLNERVSKGSYAVPQPVFRGSGGSFLWDIWRSDVP